MEKSNVFVRESSGLIKQVNMLDVIMLNVGNMSAGLALYSTITPYVQPGSNLLVATLIGFILAIPQALIYTYFIRKVPRTGGDYVWISRTLHGSIGVIMALSLMIESVAYFALTAFFASSAIQSVLSEIGSLNGQTSMVNLGNYLASPIPSFILAFAVMAVIVAINIIKAKWGYSLITILGLFSLFTTILAMGVLAVNAGDFSIKIQPVLKALNITYVTYNGPSFDWNATLFMLPFLALYTFPWMQAGPAVAAEIKGKNALKYNVFISLILTFIIVQAGYGLMYYVGGYGFTTAEYMQNGFVYTFWSVAIGLTNNIVLEWIIGLGLIAWEFFILAYGVIVFSRYIFAMAFDRVLPSIFASVSKNGSPVYTHLLDLGLVTMFLAVIFFLGSSNAISLYGATILGALYFLVVSIAGLIHGIKNKVSILIPASVVSIGYFAYLTYVSGTNPDFGFMTSTGVDFITLVFVLGTLIGSAIVYAVSYMHNKSKGVDLNLVYKEIPPE